MRCESTIGPDASPEWHRRRSLSRALDALRPELARLYDRPEVVRLVAHDIGLPLEEIYFSRAAVSVWAEVLDVARRRGRLAELAAYVTQEFPRDPHLGVAAAELLAALGDRTNATPTVYDGLDDLPDDTGANVRAFVDEYLGGSDTPVPFGGRGPSLAALDGLLTGANRCALLRAPAGRGKSALLVRWAQRLVEQGDVDVVFVPVSIRFQTSSDRAFFRALVARLAKIHGEALNVARDHPVDWWRGQASRLLDRESPSGKGLVVIVDGLDERVGWRLTSATMSTVRRPSLRVVCSVREQAADVDGLETLRELGWDRPGACVQLSLPVLTGEGVAEVITRMGVPLDKVGARADILRELQRLTEGDPLLVKLYVEDLWTRRGDVARLRVDDLRDIRAGLEGYFERWWSDQTQAWDTLGRPHLQGAARNVLDVCSQALGPLNRDDLSALTAIHAQQIDDAVRDLRRWFSGDVQRAGITFSHPRLAAYFAERQTDEEQRGVTERFLAWGRAARAALAAGAPPRQTPAYLARHQAAHLTRAGAPPTAFAALLTRPWRDASAALLGDLETFLDDVAAAWACFRAADRELRAHNEAERWFGLELRCQLILTSVANLERNVPPTLAARAYELGEWTAEQAIGYMRRRSGDERPVALALASGEALGVAASAWLTAWAKRQDATTADDVLRRITAAQHVAVLKGLAGGASTDTALRAAAVLACASVACQPPARLPESFASALRQMEALPDRDDRRAALASLLPWLPSGLTLALLPVGPCPTAAEARCSALYDVDEGPSRSRRSAEIAAVAPRLPPELVEVVINAAETSGAPSCTAGALQRMSGRAVAARNSRGDIGDTWGLTEGDVDALSGDEADAMVRAVMDELDEQKKRSRGGSTSGRRLIGFPRGQAGGYSRGDTSTVFHALQPPVARPLAKKILRILDQPRVAPVNVLLHLSPLLAPPTRAFLLERWLHVSHETITLLERLSTRAIFATAVHMVAHVRQFVKLPWPAATMSPELIRIAVTLLEGVWDEEALGDLIGCLAAHVVDDDVGALIRLVRRTGEVHVGRVIGDLAHRLPPDLTADVLHDLATLARGRARSVALAALAAGLTGEGVEAYVEAIPGLEHAPFRAEALAAIARRLPGARGEDALVAAVDTARADPDTRTAVLDAIAPRLSRRSLALALEAATTIGDSAACAWTLDALRGGETRSEESARPTVREVVVAELGDVAAISDESLRASALISVAPRVGRDAFADALAVANTLTNQSAYARALAALSPRIATKHLHVVLSHIRVIGRKEDRLSALEVVVARLPPEHLGAAFEVYRACAVPEADPAILRSIARRAPLALFEELLAEVASMSSPATRSEVLGVIFSRLPVDEACERLRSLQSEERAVSLRVFQDALPPLAAALGAGVISDVVDAVTEVMRMWP